MRKRTQRFFAAACALIFLVSGCRTETTSEASHTTVPGEVEVADVDIELYWHQRGSDAAEAIWTAYRLNDGALLANIGESRPLAFAYSAQAFSVLLDCVGFFWRKDRATAAVDAYFSAFTEAYPDRAAIVCNDDVLLWVIACTRAARITGDDRYLAEARALYDRIWLTQVDSTLGGGMWRHSDVRDEKRAGGNFTAAVAALNLYTATTDVKYLLQGRTLYSWASKNFFDSETGAVSDRLTAAGEREDLEYSSNCGAFIGASLRLYRATGTRSYLSAAMKAAQRMVETQTEDGILLPLGDGSLNGIAVRYLAELARRPGCTRYREFLLDNARTAWTSRRLSDGINGHDWTRLPFDGEVVEAQTALSAAMLYFAASRAFR